MADRERERAALALFIDALRVIRSLELASAMDNADDFPDFVLSRLDGGPDVWVEVVEAVESGQLLAAERRAQRLYDAAAREYRARGEEIVLTVSPQGVESVTPSPGLGVSGVVVPGHARRIAPAEWITRALEQKGRVGRYGPAERARTTLLVDCSREVLIDIDDADDARRGLGGNTLGFEEVWSVSMNWAGPQAVLLAP